MSEGIHINKTNASKEFDICHYGYFLGRSFKYEPYLCIDCFNLMRKAITFNDVAIVSVKESGYRFNFWYMSKNKMMQ